MAKLKQWGMSLISQQLSVLMLTPFRSRNKFGMTVERMEAPRQLMYDLNKLLLIKTTTPATVILNLVQDLKGFTVHLYSIRGTKEWK